MNQPSNLSIFLLGFFIYSVMACLFAISVKLLYTLGMLMFNDNSMAIIFTVVLFFGVVGGINTIAIQKTKIK